MKLFVVLCCLITAQVYAQTIHYFGSVMGAKTTVDDNNIQFDDIKNKPTFTELITAGVSVSTDLAEKLPAMVQLIYQNDSTIAVDLLQVRHNFEEGFLVRAGRQRLPFTLHSENVQIQALLPWVTAPREVYAKQPIYSFTGLAVEKNYGEYLNFHLYGGDTRDVFLVEQEYTVETKNLVGGRFNFKKDNLSLFLNHYQAEGSLRLSSDVDIGSGATGKFKQTFQLDKIRGSTLGAEYRPGEFLFMSEYAVLSSQSRAYNKVEAFYVSAGKEFDEKWLTLLTFSTDLDVSSELSPTKTSTYGFNVNYRLNLNNVLKFGVEHVNLKERTVMADINGTATAVNSTVLANATPEENFDVYSVMWAFVY